MEQTITLARADGVEKPPPQPVGHLLAEVPDMVRQCVSMRFRGRSRNRGRPPRWLVAASDVRLLDVSVNGIGTTVVFDAPPLGEAAGELYEQLELFATRPDACDTGFDLLGDLLLDVERGDETSEWFDPAMLDGLGSLGKVLDGTFHELHVNSRRYPLGEPAIATGIAISNAKAMREKTPPSRRIRLVGELDAVRISTGAFALKLDDGNEVRGVVETEQIDQLLELMRARQRALVRGEAIFKPTGQLLLINAEEVVSGVDERPVWSRLPSFAKGSVRSQRLHRRQTRKTGLAAIIGQWPGDETDEEIAAALRELS